MKRKALASLGLSLLFIVVYGNCNRITAMRHDVGTMAFGWEESIPFIPWMIVPYMSIDLFFAASPFLCRTEQELATHAKRIVFAILAAALCFLLLPLRLVFVPPPVDGVPGAIFHWFRGVDAPYNLLPSLHITLASILAVLYARHTRGWLRMLSNTWFVLISASTVFTYQHQVVDLLGGFMLAGLCFYLFPEQQAVSTVVPNPHVGGLYAVAALTVLALMYRTGPWGWPLLWPALSLGLMAMAYFGGGPGVYRKSHGVLPWSTRFVLGPVLLGQHLSLAYYRTQCRPWDVVEAKVWIGRTLNDAEAAQAVRQGVTAVLDLTAEFDEARPFRETQYLSLPILDLTAPSPEQLRQMADFIERQPGIVYVHCKVGYSRSAAAVAAWLLRTGRAATVDAALAILRQARPSIIIRPEIVTATENYPKGCD